MAKIWIIIPVYNEDSSLPKVVTLVRRQGYKNIIVVDDGSHVPVKVSGVTVVRHAINRGKGAATKTGIDAALLLGADYLVTLDGDGQHDPTDIAKLLTPLRRGYDVSLGYRDFARMPALKLFANVLSNILTGLLYDIWVKDTMCGFKAYIAASAQTIDTHQDDYEFENEVIGQIAHHGLKFTQVPVRTIYTDYSRRKSTRLDLPHTAKIVYKLLFAS